MRAAPESQPVLERRFEKTGGMEDLEEAIRKAQQTVEVTPQDHLDLADRLSNQGRCFFACLHNKIVCAHLEDIGMYPLPFPSASFF